MRGSASDLRILMVAALALAALTACQPPQGPPAGSAAGGTGGSATPGGGRAGAGGAASGSAGSGGMAGAGGMAGVGGAGAANGTSDASAPAGGDAQAGSGPTADGRSADRAPTDQGGNAGPGWAGIPGLEDLSTVKPTLGCGKAPTQALGSWVRSTVTINPKPVRGTGDRVYFVKLPANYDRMKPYRLIFVVPGCNGSGDQMFDYTQAAGAEGVIQIGLNPDPGASSVAGARCFDDFRTDSVEPKFFETLLEIASNTLCFDQHRVFFTGHSSGSFISNMMGCMYGSTKVRAIAPSSGGLATNEMGPNQAPPCKDLPTPGIFSHNEDDNGNLIRWTVGAINRALKVNRCQGDFNTSPRVPYPGEPDCQRFSTCPAEFPIVLCHPRTGGHLGNLGPQPVRAWKFFTALP